MLRHLAQKSGWGRRLEVDSAGTTNYHVGEPPDRRSQVHALRRGYDLSGQRARQVDDADFRRFDWILAMDRGHLLELREQGPVLVHDRIRLLLDFAPGLEGRDVPDPYYGGEGGFEQVLDLVEEGCRGFLAEMARR